MSTLIAIWARLPVVAQAILAGLAVAAAGIAPWAALASANIAWWSSVPWAVVPGALYLLLFWRYANGAGAPRSTAQTRRMHARANAVPPDVWPAALLAGVVGLVMLVLGMDVYNHLVRLPAASGQLAGVPFVTAACLVLMGSLVAGVVEETACRGYMQGPMERRHGGLVAVSVTSVVFASMHFARPEVTMTLMPFFLTVGLLYGGIAHLTDSTLPGMVVHASGNAFAFMNMLATGQAEWQTTAAHQPLVWETGADAPFWKSVGAAVVALAATVWAYVALARLARSARQPVTLA